jgi:hypothetical protein
MLSGLRQEIEGETWWSSVTTICTGCESSICRLKKQYSTLLQKRIVCGIKLPWNKMATRELPCSPPEDHRYLPATSACLIHSASCKTATRDNTATKIRSTEYSFVLCRLLYFSFIKKELFYLLFRIMMNSMLLFFWLFHFFSVRFQILFYF